MKVRIIIWSAVAVLAVIVVVVLATGSAVTGGATPDFSREDLLAFAGRMEGRLGKFGRRYELAKLDAPASPAAESSVREIDVKLAECRVLLDSLRREEDATAGEKIRERVLLVYGRAKDWLFKLKGLAGEEPEGSGD